MTLPRLEYKPFSNYLAEGRFNLLLSEEEGVWVVESNHGEFFGWVHEVAKGTFSFGEGVTWFPSFENAHVFQSQEEAESFLARMPDKGKTKCHLAELTREGVLRRLGEIEPEVLPLSDFVPARYAFDGQLVWLRWKEDTALRCLVETAAGQSVRVVNKARALQRWVDVDQLYIRKT